MQTVLKVSSFTLNSKQDYKQDNVSQGRVNLEQRLEAALSFAKPGRRSGMHTHIQTQTQTHTKTHKHKDTHTQTNIHRYTQNYTHNEEKRAKLTHIQTLTLTILFFDIKLKIDVFI
jgi:hypothetical protein